VRIRGKSTIVPVLVDGKYSSILELGRKPQCAQVKDASNAPKRLIDSRSTMMGRTCHLWLNRSESLRTPNASSQEPFLLMYA
jgi:hypothetical protein